MGVRVYVCVRELPSSLLTVQLCCEECFKAYRDRDHRLYCPLHLASGLQQLRSLRIDNILDCGICMGGVPTYELVDVPCGTYLGSLPL